MNNEILQAAYKIMGSLGGSAGKGAAKRRSPEFYAELSKKGHEGRARARMARAKARKHQAEQFPLITESVPSYK